MKTAVLRLEGPLQSWATQSKHGQRLTEREPSKSGVLGIVAAALGVPREDTHALTELATLELAVRIDRPGTLLRDYHTAGGGTFRGSRKYTVHGAKNTVTSERFYLQGASFVALLGGEASLVDRITEALRNPRWPLFLGRRSCVPTCPILEDVRQGTPRELLPKVPPAENSGARLRALIECGPDEGQPRFDVPVCFATDRREHARRFVRNVWVTPATAASREVLA